MIAKDRNNTRRWLLPATLFVLLAAMGLTISAALAAAPFGPPVDKGTTGAADSGSVNQSDPNKIEGCIPDRDYTYTTSTGASLIPGTTLVPGSQTDDGTTVLALPFPITFYGVTASSVNLGSNGNLQLSSSNVTQVNVCLPATTMNNLVAPFWDDLDLSTTNNASCPGGTCGVFTALTGSPGSQVFTIEWRGVLIGTTTPVDFEVNLYENDPNNRIDFVYGQTGNGGGSGATVGIQKGTGAKYTQVSCNTASLVNGERITLQQIPCGAATFTPTSTPTSTPTATQTATPAPCGPGAPYIVMTTTNQTLIPGVTDIGNHGDDVTTTVTLPFIFRLYNQPFTRVNASSNGNLQFTSASLSFSNICLPSLSLNNALMPYWDDMRTDGATGEGIFTTVTGSTPNRVFVIEWRTCIRTSSSPCASISTNFEVELYETPLSGGTEFSFVYGAMLQNGSSATVGVQKGTGQDFTQYECNTAGSLQNGLMLNWKPYGCGSPTLTSTPTRSITPTNTVTLTRTATDTPTITLTPRPQGTCGPDANYTMTTSTNATLAPGTTDIGNHTDDGTTFITLPFTFNFYGIEFDSANVSSNGALQFVSDNENFLDGCLPDTTFDYAMFPYGDDLRTDILTGTVPSGIFTAEEGPPGDRIFDIEWRAAFYKADNEMVNFEVRLYENPGSGNISRFDYVYQEDPGGGNSATVGAQRDTGSAFAQYECLTGGSISPGLRISFTQPVCGTGTPVPTATPACTPYAVGHLTWQTVPQPNTRSAQPVSVTIKSGVTEVNASVTADASGFFTVPLGTSFPSGAASWRVKGPRHLANCGVFNVVSGCSQSNFDTGTQRGGDANPSPGNNIVNSQDFATLKAQFGQAGCTLASDFDFTCVVNSQDFTVLKGNFGQAGCGPIFGPESTK